MKPDRVWPARFAGSRPNERSASFPYTLASAGHTMPTTPHPLQCLDAIAAIRPCHHRQEICRQGQAANTWYWVLSGVAVRCVNKSDGRRQVVDLLLPGDFFGLSTGNEYDYAVEVSGAWHRHCRVSTQAGQIQADANPELARELRQITFDRLSRLQEQLLILGRVTAQGKVGASFFWRWRPVCRTTTAIALRYQSLDMTLRTIWRSRSKP